MSDIRSIIAFARNEQLIREYFAFKMYYPVKAKINLALTNKRLILYSSKQSLLNFEDESLYQQINIEDIRGLEILQSKRYSISAIIVCGLFLAAGGVLFSLSSIVKIIEIWGILLLLSGIIGIVLCFVFPKKVFVFQIKGVTQNLTVGEFIDIKPVFSVGPDIQKIVQELGAVILELQE